MKLKTAIVISLVLLFASRGISFAQADSIWLKGIAPAQVTALKVYHKYVRAKRWMSHEEKLLKIPYERMDSLRYADGFKIRFKDGALVRDNLLEAPNMQATLSLLLAEKTIPLTQDEIRRYYGDRLYSLVYNPYRLRGSVDAVKIVTGLTGSILIWTFKRPVWYSYNTQYADDLERTHYLQYSYGNFSLGWLVASTCMQGLLFGGIADAIISNYQMNHLQRTRETYQEPSLARARWEFWGGAALTAAGVGAMALCAAQLSRHTYWEHYIDTVGGKVFDEKHEGEPASKGFVYGMLLGGTAISMGLSLLQFGQHRLSAFKKLEGTPYAAQFSVGPTLSGYGLTVKF